MNKENKLSGVIFIIFRCIIRRFISQFFRKHGMPSSNVRFEVYKTAALFGSDSRHLIDGLVSQIIFFTPHISISHDSPNTTDRDTFALIILVTVNQAFRFLQVRKNDIIKNVVFIRTLFVDGFRILFSRFCKQRYVSPNTDSIEVGQSTQCISLSKIVISVCHVRHTDIRNIFNSQICLVNHLIQSRPLCTFLIRRH